MAWLAGAGAFLLALAASESSYVGLIAAFLVFVAVRNLRKSSSQGQQQREKSSSVEYELSAQRQVISALDARIRGLEQQLAALDARWDAAGERVPAEPPPVKVEVLAETRAEPQPSAEEESAALDERGFPVATPTQPSQEPAQPFFAGAPEGTLPFAGAPEEGALGPTDSAPSEPPESAPDPLEQLLAAARAWLLGGNTVARVGVLVLVVGVALLVKYAADHAYFPLELRLAMAALTGLGLAGFGFRVREAKRDFSLSLQGGGVAATYLVVFFSYRAYGLLPSGLAFALLAVLGVAHVVLAVLQNAESLALVGLFGGFLAPVLASSGGGSHVGLFSYYALLNGGVFAIAWFRPFRWVNLLGFVCTFGIGTAWGVLRYEPAHVWSAGGFLVLFFVYYSLAAVLFAWRQPDPKRRLIDSSLTFGTPLATFGLMTALLRPFPYGIALGTVAMGGYYVMLASFLWKRAPALLRAQIEAFVALGIGFVTLAIPFALDDHHVTGIAWATESVGLCWVGMHQRRLRPRLFGYALFLLSVGAVLLADAHHLSGTLLLSRVVLALCAWGISMLVERYAAQLGEEALMCRPVFVIGLFAWCAAIHAFLVRYVPEPEWRALTLGLLTLSAGLLEIVGSWRAWAPGRWMARLLAVATLGWLIPGLYEQHPFERHGYIALPLALALSFWIGRRSEAGEIATSPRLDWRFPYYVLLVWQLAVLGFVEAGFGVERAVPTSLTWAQTARVVALVAHATFWLSWTRRERWPFARMPLQARIYAVAPVLGVAQLYVIVLALVADGSIAPLPFVPVINPLDLAACSVLVVGVRWMLAQFGRAIPRELIWWLGAMVFAWLNTALVRAVCNLATLPYTPQAMLESPLVQSAVSIFWAVLGLAAMVTASRKRLRSLWWTGGALLTAVVGKLFLSDLATLSSGIKIVTFLAVGALMIAVGYVAPVPPAEPYPAREGT